MKRPSQKPTANTILGGDTGTVLTPACAAARAYASLPASPEAEWKEASWDRGGVGLPSQGRGLRLVGWLHRRRRP